MRVRSLLAIPTAYLFQRETKRPRFDWEEAEATPAATTTTDATSVPATAPAPESSAPQNQVNNNNSGDNSAAVAVRQNTRRSNRVLRSNGLSGVTDANSDKENNSNSNSDGHNHYFANDDDEEEDFADSFSELTVSEKTKHDDEHMGTNVGVKTARKSQQRKRKHSESEMITDSDSIRVPFQSPSNTANSAAAAAAATAQPSTSVNISLTSLRKQSRTATANTSTATATITTTAIFNSTTSAANNNNNNNNNTSSTEGTYSSSSSTSPSSSATQQQQQQQPKPVVTQHHHHHHPKSMKPTEWKKWLADYLELVKEVKASQPPPPPPRQPTAFCRWTACEWSGFHVDDLEEHLQEVHIDVQPFFDERGRVMKWAKPQNGVQGKVQGKNTGKITAAADNQPSTSTAATPHAKHSSSSSSSKTVCRRSQRSTRTCSVVTETAREEFVCLWADCPVYGKPYDTREGLGKHIRRLHFQKKVVRVATSKKSASSFSSANSFFSSSSSTVGPIDLPYRCTITAKKEDKIGEQTCPMRFRTGAALQKHLKEDHPNGSILEIYRKLPFFALNPPNARPRVNQNLNSFSVQAGNEVVEAARATIMKATGVTKAFREVKMMEVRQKGPNGSSQKTLICPPKGAKNEDLKTMFVFDERLFNYNRPINPTYPLSQLVPYAKHSSNSSGNLNGKQSQDYNKVTKDNNISSNNNNTKKKKKVKVGESGNDLSNDKIGKDNDKTINKSRKRKASSS